MSEDGPEGEPRKAVVLDYLPHGRADDDRPQYQKRPLAHALGIDNFRLYELVVEADDAPSIGDEVAVSPAGEGIDDVRRIDHDDLSGGARSELIHAVRDVVERDESRFVEFYNEAGPITLRLHQLNLLPGIGDKLRDTILEQRERNPFGTLADVDDRITGLHDPMETLVDRIMEEIRDEDVKYRLFAREPAPEQ